MPDPRLQLRVAFHSEKKNVLDNKGGEGGSHWKRRSGKKKFLWGAKRAASLSDLRAKVRAILPSRGKRQRKINQNNIKK